MYADDGLYYGDIDQPIITPNSGMLEGNIYFNLAKSGYVKKDGIWLQNLNFLGLSYDGLTDKLTARTRKGSTLEYDKQELIKEFIGEKKLWKALSVSSPYPMGLSIDWKLVNRDGSSLPFFF